MVSVYFDKPSFSQFCAFNLDRQVKFQCSFSLISFLSLNCLLLHHQFQPSHKPKDSSADNTAHAYLFLFRDFQLSYSLLTHFLRSSWLFFFLPFLSFSYSSNFVHIKLAVLFKSFSCSLLSIWLSLALEVIWNSPFIFSSKFFIQLHKIATQSSDFNASSNTSLLLTALAIESSKLELPRAVFSFHYHHYHHYHYHHYHLLSCSLALSFTEKFFIAIVMKIETVDK